MDKLVITNRDLKGTSNARRMRHAGQVPGVIYSDGNEARKVSIPHHEFKMMLRRHAGEQMMLDVELEGKTLSVLLKDVQHEMLSDGIVHIDFQEVDLTKRIRVSAAIELVGEPKGVSVEGGVLDHLMHAVDVECLPGDMLESIEVDVSDMAVGDMLFVKDLPLDASKFEVMINGDIGVATIAAPRVAVESDEEGEAAAE